MCVCVCVCVYTVCGERQTVWKRRCVAASKFSQGETLLECVQDSKTEKEGGERDEVREREREREREGGREGGR